MMVRIDYNLGHNLMPTLAKEDEFLRRFTESEEEARSQPGYRWNGGRSWFSSGNVIDLERHRSREELRRMVELAHERWLNQWNGGRRWPP